MNKRFLLTAASAILLTSLTIAQRYDSPRPLSPKDRILMSLDSLDRIYLSRLRPREQFGANRMIDRISQSVDRLGRDLEDRERMLQDRERDLRERERNLDDRERALQEKERNRDWRHDGDRDRDHDRAQHDTRVYPIEAQDFEDLVKTVDQAPFARDKKIVVRASAANHFFLIDQVVRLASKFPFDDDRLEVIEAMYPKVLDQDKNYLLYNCFTFSDAKNKLEKFINDFNAKGGR